MKPHSIVWLAPLLLTGCNVPAWGNIFVLAVTLALFCATVTLGKHISPEGDHADPPDSEILHR